MHHAPRIARARLIETTTDAAAPPPKGRAAVALRLDRLDVALGARIVVPHETGAVAAALTAPTDAELTLILTASATSDAGDVGPAALIGAGGRVTRFGMPVDPGNLLFLGTLGDAGAAGGGHGNGGHPVIGLPGCARSPALNGADWVMERVICGIAVTGADIAAMGVGGLLKDVAARGRPREG